MELLCVLRYRIVLHVIALYRMVLYHILLYCVVLLASARWLYLARRLSTLCNMGNTLGDMGNTLCGMGITLCDMGNTFCDTGNTFCAQCCKYHVKQEATHMTYPLSCLIWARQPPITNTTLPQFHQNPRTHAHTTKRT